MNKLMILAVSSVVVAATGMFNPAPVDPPVNLQATTPGSPQTGHANITGTFLAGSVTASSGLASAKAIIGNATSLTGTTFGGVFQSASGSGRGIYGSANSPWGSTFGGYFRNASTAGRAVFGTSTATSGFAYGGEFRSASVDGRGVYGVSTSLTSNTYGGNFSVDSVDGIAVRGDANAATGTTWGGYFYCGSPTGYGVYGLANDSTGANYAVYGVTNSQANGYALYGVGNFAVTGTKAFRIDHPDDPENKYLLHYCAEGPEPLNVYGGIVRTGSDGRAWVQLPSYCEEINKDFRYQLTIIDSGESFVQAQVSREVSNGKFQIRTSRPGVRVSWELKGVRNDRFVRTYGAPVVVEKPEGERGYYQHPELYGQPAERGLDAHRRAMKTTGTSTLPTSQR